MPQFLQRLREALAAGDPFVVGIIATATGSSPQKAGAKAILFGDGRIWGTLGGGCLEAEICDRARRALLARQPAKFELVLDHDFGWDDGLICGGSVSVVIVPVWPQDAQDWQKLAALSGEFRWGIDREFRPVVSSAAPADWLYTELILTPHRLWIAGSGHIAQAVAPWALQLEFEVTVFDDRPALANHQLFPKAVQLCVNSWDRVQEEKLPAQPVLGLIVTRGHRHDALVLKEWIHRPFVFLGMIGSRRKARTIFEQFQNEGLATAEQLARVACPVGLEIQSVSVPEIAVSILAQCVQKRAADRARQS